MREKTAIFLYPITKEINRNGSNSYIKQLAEHLNQNFRVINQITSIGLLDALAKFRKTDIYYFNWIEDLPNKRLGLIQVIILPFLLIFCKLTGKKIIWFIHNNISHSNKFLPVKKFIIALMSICSDLILSHSNEITLAIPKRKLHVFPHPLENFHQLPNATSYMYDLLIWGSVSPYKGIYEFVRFASSSLSMAGIKILIAGKFHSEKYHETVLQYKADNIYILNQVVSEEELIGLFAQSRYILFTYASSSVLSSAALCKSLSFGKEVIAPALGSFKELGAQQLLHNYTSFSSLEKLLLNLETGKAKKIDEEQLRIYAEKTTWKSFNLFLEKRISALNKKKRKQVSCLPFENSGGQIAEKT